MEARKLLLLGLLLTASGHGYQLNENIEANFGGVVEMSKTTAYAILQRLAKAGDVRVRDEPQPNRPPRKVYSITPQGEALFLTLLRENLASAAPLVLAGDAGLLFIDALRRDEAAGLLNLRLAALRAKIAEYERMRSVAQGFGMELAVGRHLALLRADEVWLTDVLHRLKEP